MDDDLYAIKDMNGYVTEMRFVAAQSLSDHYEDFLDEYITVEQMINLVKSECVGFDDEDRPLLNEDANEKIFESMVTWIHNAGLAKLAAKGLIECAWDDSINEMVFWNNDIGHTKKKKGKSSVKRRNPKKDKGS